MRSILTCVMIAYASAAMAHDAATGWTYDPYCCNGNAHNGDCQMIPSKAVAITPEGYLLTLKPGDHRLVTRSHIFLLPMTRAMHSGDSEYHLCLFPNEDTPRCFYAPDMGF